MSRIGQLILVAVVSASVSIIVSLGVATYRLYTIAPVIQSGAAP